MNLPDLREESRLNHIIEIIELLAMENECHLWQDFTKFRSQLDVDFNSIDKEKEEIIFNSLLDPNIKFNPALPIYFYESKKECVFKSTIKWMSADKVILNIPENILALENRLFIRSKPEDNAEVSFSLNIGDKEQLYSKEVIDISERGLSFKIIGREYLHFYEGDKILFHSELCDVTIPSKIGTIMYSAKQEEKKLSKNMTYKVGVCFK